MYFGRDLEGNFFDRFLNFDSHEYVTACVVESYIVDALRSLKGDREYLPQRADLDILTPLLLKLYTSAIPDENFYDQAVEQISNALTFIDYDLRIRWASKLFWSVTIDSNVESPAILYAKTHAKTYLAKVIEESGRRDILDIPLGITAWDLPLMAAFSTPTPRNRGSGAIFIHNGLIAARDFCWGNMVKLTRQHMYQQRYADGRDTNHQWAMKHRASDFSLLEYFFRKYNINPAFESEVSNLLPAMRCDCSPAQDLIDRVDRNTDIVLAFLILHEVGHIALNHLNETRETPPERHNAEFEADRFALQILQSDPNFDTGDFSAIFYLFEFFIQKKSFSGESFDSRTHPSEFSRISRLIRASNFETSFKNTVSQKLSQRAEIYEAQRQRTPHYFIRRQTVSNSLDYLFSPPPKAFDPLENRLSEELISHPDTIPLSWESTEARQNQFQIWRFAFASIGLKKTLEISFSEWLKTTSS